VNDCHESNLSSKKDERDVAEKDHKEEALEEKSRQALFLLDVVED